MNIKRQSMLLISVLVVLGIHCITKASDSNEQGLKALARMYPLYEKYILHSFPQFGSYTPSLDTSLIKRYASLVVQVLSKKQLTKEDKRFVKKIAWLMTRGSVYRNASSDSRWRNYARQAIIQALNTSKEGIAILDELTAHNPQLEVEREAYSLSFE